MTRKKLIPRLIAIAAVAFGGLSASPVSASTTDTFQAIPGPLVVTTVVAPDIDPESAGGTTSTAEYGVTATVTGQAFVNTWEWVKLCFYNESIYSDYSPAGSPLVDTKIYGGLAPSACGNAAASFLDTNSNAFEMTWTAADGTFALTNVADNNYALGTATPSSVTYSNPDVNVATAKGQSLSIDIVFRFKVSNAMAAGTQWRALVAAKYSAAACEVDEEDACGLAAPGIGAAESADKTVSFFAHITTPKGTTDFGLIAQGSASTKDDIIPAQWVSNGPADLALLATDFATGSPGSGLAAQSLTLLQEAGNPSSAQVALDCKSNEADSDPKRLGKTNVGEGNAGNLGPVKLAVSFPATGEAPVNTTDTIVISGTNTNKINTSRYAKVTDMTCTLSYGGGALYAFRSYAATVTTSIGPYSAP